jgi:hypothetical protein
MHSTRAGGEGSAGSALPEAPLGKGRRPKPCQLSKCFYDDVDHATFSSPEEFGMSILGMDPPRH